MAMIIVVNIYVRYNTNSEKEQSGLLPLLMVILNLMIRLCCWKLLNPSSQIWRNKAGNDLELLLYQNVLHRQAGRGGKSSKVFSCESWQYGHDWLGSFGIFDVTGIIHGFLIGFRTLWDRTHVWYCKIRLHKSQLDCDSTIIGISGDLTTFLVCETDIASNCLWSTYLNINRLVQLPSLT